MDTISGYSLADHRLLYFQLLNCWDIQYPHHSETKIIDMLAAEKENDPELKKSRWIAAVVLLFEGFTVWMLLTGVQK